MTKPLSPERWAFDLTKVLNTVLGAEHFPIKVIDVAKEYSSQRFPGDAITLVSGDSLPGFDGALYPAPAGKRGWGIIFNSALNSKGRINFTLAHEFGHYLLHRLDYPAGIRCGEQDVVRWDSEYGQVEHQANRFAANLLMPLDDFRRQIDARDRLSLEAIQHCAERYEVSLIAAILRWLLYTERRAVLVVSVDDFILWSRASKPALRTGAFFRTANRPPIEIPSTSAAARPREASEQRVMVDHPAGVWFAEEHREICVFAERYGFVASVILLEDREFVGYTGHEEEDSEDVFTRMQAKGRRSSLPTI